MRCFRSSRPCDYITLRRPVLLCRKRNFFREAKGKLDRAGTTGLKEWTHLAHGITRIEPCGEHLGGRAKSPDRSPVSAAQEHIDWRSSDDLKNVEYFREEGYRPRTSLWPVRLYSRGYDADLLEEREIVFQMPVVSDTAIADTQDVGGNKID
jgi:hypothetical protein